MRFYLRKWCIVAAILGMCCGGTGLRETHGDSRENITDVLATDGTADNTIRRLRELGPASLDILFELRDRLTKDKEYPARREEAVEQLRRLDAAIDQVSGQRYGSVSRLFWYTDLEKARVAAMEQNKPIISLRMLGNLTDEYSCANSRFFRTTLYTNMTIAKRLRDGFVLHWEAVRPVPVATIDFGDGRVLRRTLTGNSIHYALLPDGRLIDGLPGLNNAPTFQEWLSAVEGFSRDYSEAQRNQPITLSKKAVTKNISSAEENLGLLRTMTKTTPTVMSASNSVYANLLQKFHRDRYARIIEHWNADLQKVVKAGQDPVAVANEVRAIELNMSNAAQQRNQSPPPAKVAGKLAITKSIVEIKMVSAIETSRKQSADLETATSERIWEALGVLHENVAVIDSPCRELIVKENPVGTNFESAELKLAALSVLFQKLKQSIAMDTVRNEYLMHRKIHDWLASGPQILNVNELNARVYNELFLTPKSDPWLGLVSPNSYSGLENNGIVEQ